MSDASQPGYEGPHGSRLSRRTLRERAAQMDAEAAAPEPLAAITELDTAPTEAAPVSRVVRRSTTRTPTRNTPPPSQIVFSPTQPQTSQAGAPGVPAAFPPPQVKTPAAPVNPVAAPAISPAAPAVPVAAPVILPPIFDPISPVVSQPSEITNSDLVGAGAVSAQGVPPWEAITSGAESEIVVAERHALRSEEAVRVSPPSAGYTWLQYLILLAVAFVLGLLLWQLIIGEIPIPHAISDIYHRVTAGPLSDQLFSGKRLL